MASDNNPQRVSMSCLDCGYPLDGLDSTVCPECGCEYDPDDTETFNRILPDPVRLARLSITEANAACMMLEHNGVPAKVHKEGGGVIGYADSPQGSLWVDRADEARAREMLDAMVHKAEYPTEPWTCAECTEQIESQFDVCWNCGSERPEA